MKTRLRPVGIAALLCATCTAGTAAQPEAGKATDRCEAAVAETIRNIRGREAQAVEFSATKRMLPPGAGDETDVRGEGRYRSPAGGSMPFTYSCAFNAKTGTTSGVMFRETGAARGSQGAEKAWQPDLTNVSPDACEAATAVALKDKYPRVGRIAFGSDTRQLKPAPNAHVSLEGQGALQRAPGMNSAPFKYRCEFEGRSGKIVSVQTSE